MRLQLLTIAAIQRKLCNAVVLESYGLSNQTVKDKLYSNDGPNNHRLGPMSLGTFRNH